MGDYRAKMRAGRGKLHERMSTPAIYLPAAGSRSQISISVRVHEFWKALGDLKGTNFNYAEVEDISPRIVFLLSEVSPKRGAIVSVAPGEAYRVDLVLPHDDITVTAKVVKYTAEEAKGFPVPEGST